MNIWCFGLRRLRHRTVAMAKFFDREKFIPQKILKSMATHGLRQAADLVPWLQEPRTVNRQQGEGFFAAKSGIFTSKKTGKEVQWESKNEEAILKALDRMPEVMWFDTQCIQFTYAGTEDQYNYTPDIVVRMSHDQIVIIEAKPAKFVCAQSNYRKYLAGKQLCGKNDWHFIKARCIAPLQLISGTIAFKKLLFDAHGQVVAAPA